MAVQQAGVELRRLITEGGRSIAHGMFPMDVEMYLMALELADSQGRTVDYFSFPVLPQEYSIGQPEITNIKKTAGGITALSTTTFIPRQIRLAGSFGRRLRFLIGAVDTGNITAFSFSTNSGVFTKEGILSGTPINLKNNVFNPRVKTGYGAMKVMEAILNKSTALDDQGLPMRLYFYNLAFGESYMVKVADKTFRMNEGNMNMMWHYDVHLTAIATLSQIRSEKDDKKNMVKMLGLNMVQKGVNVIAGGLLQQRANRRQARVASTRGRGSSLFRPRGG